MLSAALFRDAHSTTPFGRHRSRIAFSVYVVSARLDSGSFGTGHLSPIALQSARDAWRRRTSPCLEQDPFLLRSVYIRSLCTVMRRFDCVRFLSLKHLFPGAFILPSQVGQGKPKIEPPREQKNNALHGNIRRGRIKWLFIRDFQLHTAVDDIAFQSVQTDDLLVAVTVTEILLCDCPEGISVRYGMNAIVLGRL